MKRKASLHLILVCLSSFFMAQAQENSIWYSYALGGDKTKITELQDVLLYEQVREEESPYPTRVDSVGIVKRLNDSTYIITKKTREGDFALMASSQLHNGAIKSIGIYYPSETADVVEAAYSENGLPSWKALTTRWVFSEAGAIALENYPGYDQVTREAVLEALSVREEMSPAIKLYMEAHPNTQSFRMYRFVESKGQQKFIELGYNPYKPVSYNFEKQFEGDEEVIKALTEPISFD